MQGPGILLPADWQLPTLLSLTILTEILRFAQDDSGRRGANFRTYPQGFAQLHSGRASKRKAILNFSFPLEGNAAKRQRVYEVKNDNVAPLLLYTGPTLVDSRILCRMGAVRIVSDGMPVNTSRREG